jgi:hypothetical protein
MSYEISEIAKIRKYILGDLPESEAERIEIRYFADGQTVDEVWAAFGELAEEQLSGALSESEARRFEQRLRTSPAFRAMFENEMALRNYSARITAGVSPQANGDGPVTGGWRQWLLFGASLKTPRLMFVGVVALIALGALGAWLGLMATEGQNPASSQQAKTQEQKGPGSGAQPTVDSRRPPGSERSVGERTADSKKGATSQPDQHKSAPENSRKTTATFLLLAAGTRGEESNPTLEISPRTEALQLELEPPTDDCGAYSAVLQTESGEKLQRWEKLRAQRDHSTLKVARIRVTARALKNAGYVIRLECASGLNNPASSAQYHFRVKKNIS